MNDFGRVSYKPRVYERDFLDTVKTSSVLQFKKTQINASGVTPFRFYEVGGDVYVYCTDGTLKKAVNNTFVATGFTSAVPPLVAPIIKNGVKTVLFVGDSAASAGGESVTGVPYGTACAVSAGRLFIANGDTVKYSAEFDFTVFTEGLSFGGFLKVDKADGAVLFLADDCGKLIIVCEHALYTVTPYGEEYEFKTEKISSPALDVKKGTVCKVGNRICFINGNKLYTFSDGKVKKAGETLSSYDVGSYGTAGGKGGLYLLPLTYGNSAYLYAYDTLKESEVFQRISGYSVTDGYAVKTSDRYLYDVAAVTETITTAPTYSAEYDFGSCRRKSVCRIEAHIRGTANITVTGDGFFRATLTEKCNEVTCFVHGRSFTIAFDNVSNDFKLYRLAVHYIIYGE